MQTFQSKFATDISPSANDADITRSDLRWISVHLKILSKHSKASLRFERKITTVFAYIEVLTIWKDQAYFPIHYQVSAHFYEHSLPEKVHPGRRENSADSLHAGMGR